MSFIAYSVMLTLHIKAISQNKKLLCRNKCDEMQGLKALYRQVLISSGMFKATKMVNKLNAMLYSCNLMKK